MEGCADCTASSSVSVCLFVCRYTDVWLCSSKLWPGLRSLPLSTWLHWTSMPSEYESLLLLLLGLVTMLYSVSGLYLPVVFRVRLSVHWSVCLSGKLWKNGRLDQGVVWNDVFRTGSKNHELDGGSDCPTRRGNFCVHMYSQTYGPVFWRTLSS